MKNREKKYILCASCALMLTAFGCKEVVTDVNAQLTLADSSEIMESIQTPNIETDENLQNAANQEEDSDANIEETTPSDSDTEDTKTQNKDVLDNEDTDKEADSDEDDSEEDADKEDDDDGLEEEDSNEGEEVNNTDENANREEAPQELVIPDTFDPVFYAEHNPDVVSIFGDSPEVLYKHYLEYGMAEGRAASENAEVIPESEDNAN